MAIKMTREEYRAKYGVEPDFSSTKFQEPTKGPGAVREAFDAGVSQMKKGFEQAEQATNPLEAVESGITFGAGAIGSAFSPLAPVTKPTIGKAIEYTSEKISDIPAVQKFATTKAGETTARVAENVANLSTIAGTAAGFVQAPKVGGAFVSGARGVTSKVGKTAEYAKSVTRDVVPTSSRLIEHEVSKALDLAPSDLSNISKSTGNEVGVWMAENNLIKQNKALTQQAVNDFYKTNYQAVRTEIAKVLKVYKQSQIPRFVDSLKQILKVVKDVPGLEKVTAEVDNLLRKLDINLNDVQRVKELMDEHFSLYKVTGDVAENVTKKGLANMRREMQTFIETEVKNTTGADIHKLNNNVSTARSIDDAIITRAPKGLTRGNLKVGDLGIFGIGWGIGGPLTGFALLFGKKLLESPTVRLRIAKYLDELSDAKKAKIKAELEAGKIPTEFNQFIKKKGSEEAKIPPKRQ